MRMLAILLLILLLPNTLKAPDEEKDYYQLLEVPPNILPNSPFLKEQFLKKTLAARSDAERSALSKAFQTLSTAESKKTYDDQRVRSEIHTDPRALRLKLIEAFQLDRASLKVETFLKMIRSVQRMEAQNAQGMLNPGGGRREGGVVFSQPETLRHQAMRRLLAENANDFLACKPDFASLKTYWETMMTGPTLDVRGVGVIVEIATPAANEVTFFNDAQQALFLYGRDHLDLLEKDFVWLLERWISRNPNTSPKVIQEWFNKYSEKYGKKAIHLAEKLVGEGKSKSFYRLMAASLPPEEALEFIKNEFNKRHKKVLETKVVFPPYDEFKEALEVIYARQPSLRQQVEAQGVFNLFGNVDKACINAFVALSKKLPPTSPQE